jgi:hypothetical protein
LGFAVWGGDFGSSAESVGMVDLVDLLLRLERCLRAAEREKSDLSKKGEVIKRDREVVKRR